MEKYNIYVEVYQDKKLVNTWKDEETNKNQLIQFLWRKSVLKSNNLKVEYSYNYSDKQIISFIEKSYNCDNSYTTFEYKFYNVPTKCGYLNFR